MSPRSKDGEFTVALTPAQIVAVVVAAIVLLAIRRHRRFKHQR